MKKLGKKIFTVSVVALTIVWSVGVSAFIPTGVKAADCPELQAGDLFKAKGNSAVFLLNDDLQKMDFFNAEVYYSWYSDSLAKEGGVEVDGECLDHYNYGGTVSFRPGSKLVKGPSAAVYTMLPDGSYKKIANEAAAIKLFGTNWAKIVRDVTEGSYFSHFTKASGELDGTELVDGMLVKTSASGKVYSITDGMAYEVEGTLPKALVNDVRTVTASLLDSVEMADDTMTPAEIVADPSMGLVKGGSTGTGTPVVSGNLTASLAASTPSAQDVPKNVMVEFLRLNLAASATADATVNGIKLSSTGLGDYSQIDGVTVFVNGARYGSSRDIDSNKVAQINFTTPLVIAKGTSVTVVVKAKVTGTSKYALEVAAASDINSTASVGGSFPIRGNTMSGVDTTVGTLTFENDGTLSSVKLGDTGATVAKMKVSNNDKEDIKLNSISFKKDSTTSTIADTDVVNYKLYLDGTEISSVSSMVNKYVNFKLATPVTILKNTVKRFTVKADVVGGASKKLQLTLDNVVDVDATGQYYGYPSIISVTSFTGTDITVNAGAVTIEKVNATNTKIKKDTKDVEFGSFKVTVNSGKTVELSTLKLTVASTNDAAGTQIENVEVYVKNNNTVYDMTSSTGDGVYRNTSMGLVLNSGTTYEFVVRADTKVGATTGDYTWSIAAASTDMIMKETGNDTAVTDITPNSVSLNKVTVDVASVAFSKNALSASLSAVVGATNVELFNFNVKAGASSEVKITQLKFKDADSGSTIDKTVVSEFKLYKGTDLIKTVSANELSSEEITFSDLNLTIAADQTATYKLTTSLVKDTNKNGESMNFGLSGYSIEETAKGAAVYDTNIDSNSDGVVTGFNSARTIEIKGYGYLDVSVDNTVDATKYDSNVVAGTTGVPVATFKFNAGNEDIKVTTLKVNTSADMSASISRISLYDGDTEVAYTTNIGATTSTLDQDFTVSGQKYYTLKVNLTQIGKDQAGLVNKLATFRINSVEAEGVDSGYTLTADNGDSTNDAGKLGYETDAATTYSTGVSKTMNVVASKIGTVSLVQSYGSTALASKVYSGTQANAAIVAVTVPATNNKNSDGTALKFAINSLKLKIDQGGTWTGYTATLERIGGGTAATSTFNTTTAYMTFTGLSGSDFQIVPNSVNPVTAYFLVKVTPVFSTTNPGDTAMTVGLDGLDKAVFAASPFDSNDAAFTWKDMDGTDSASTAASLKYALNIPSVSSVSGITISN